MLTNILVFSKNLYRYEARARYYAGLCHQANTLLEQKSGGTQKELWDIIIVLGTKAEECEDCARKLHSCDKILGKIYRYKEGNCINEISKLSGREKEKKINELLVYFEKEKKYLVEGVEEREEQFSRLHYM